MPNTTRVNSSPQERTISAHRGGASTKAKLNETLWSALSVYTLECDDGARLADELTDDLIRALQRHFEGSRLVDWEHLLADWRAHFVKTLGEFATDMVDADTAIDAIIDELAED